MVGGIATGPLLSLAPFKICLDFLLPTTHFCRIGFLGKLCQQTLCTLSESSYRVTDDDFAARWSKGRDGHDNPGSVRMWGNADIFRSVSLPIRVNDRPHCLVVSAPLAKDGIASELNLVRKHGLGVPTVDPLPFPFRTEKRKSGVGATRQLKAPGALDLLCSRSRGQRVAENKTQKKENWIQQGHNPSRNRPQRRLFVLSRSDRPRRRRIDDEASDLVHPV